MSDKKKANYVTFRISDQEYEPFKEVIAELGLSKSEFFRLLVTDKLDPDKHSKKHDADYGRLLFLFNKTSNNVNQIAKKLNTLFKSGDIRETELRKWLLVLSRISKNLSEGLDHAK